jgi:pimeloyl-ACP methyl ester carboxylesterase
MADRRTFVLLHGAFHGGWCWVRVAELLRVAGHRVTTPTQTGLGERKHLMSKDITLSTFVLDLVNDIEAEDLSDVVLVGHSFGGMAITGAADRIPERLRHVVYFDARILEPGQTPMDVSLPSIREERIRTAEAFSGGLCVPPPPAVSFGVPAGEDADWVDRHLTPHPMGTFTSTLQLNNPIGNRLPCTYVACTKPLSEQLASSRAWARARPDWGWREIATGHDAMVSAPRELADMLVEVAA